MKRITLVLLAVFLLAGWQLRPQAQRRPSPKPNLLLIVADDLGYADIGVNGCQNVPTPHIDSIAKNGVLNATRWLLQKGWRNVLVEVNNECDVRAYDHEILKPARVSELIELVKSVKQGARRLLVGTSYGGGSIPQGNVVRVSDFLLLHGNGVSDPERIAAMVEQTRQLPEYRPLPILFNEDDHFNFEQPINNMRKALSVYASWGYFDPGLSNYRDGYQCPPVNWGINTERKRAFFNLVKEVTGS